MNRAGALLARVDWSILGVIAALATISVFNLHSAARGVAADDIYISQFWNFVVGLGVMGVIAAIDYRYVQRLAPFFYIGVVILLAVVLFIGREINGSRRWLDLGFVGFQPSELAKIAIMLTLASWFQKNPRPAGYSLRDLIPVGLLLALPMFLILQEPDLGHTLMILFIASTMIAFERFDRRALVVVVLVAVVAAPVAWSFVLRDYQKDRILTLVDSDADSLGSGWHAKQARVAVGSGGLLGKGHGEATQVAGGFLPETHTDFVFANLAEEQGLVGGAVVLGLYLLLIALSLRSAGLARDRFGGHIAVGVAAMIFWHVVMNMGMVLNVLPVTGVTLPLLSYGGTSVVTVMASFGLLLSINLRRNVF